MDHKPKAKRLRLSGGKARRNGCHPSGNADVFPSRPSSGSSGKRIVSTTASSRSARCSTLPGRTTGFGPRSSRSGSSRPPRRESGVAGSSPAGRASSLRDEAAPASPREASRLALARRDRFRVRREYLVRLPRLLASRDAAPASSREASRLALAVNRFRVLPGLGINCMVRMFRTVHLRLLQRGECRPRVPSRQQAGP